MLLSCLMASPTVVRAQDVDPTLAARVKAGYLLNFLRFTQWPSAPAGKVLEVVVIGDSRLARELQRVAAAAGPVGGHAVRVHELRGDRGGALGTAQRAAWLARLRGSAAVYVGEGAGAVLDTVLDALRSEPVLTVGDGAQFASRGGMLGLDLAGDRIVFDANPEAIRESGLVVSAKVLKLARRLAEGET